MTPRTHRHLVSVEVIWPAQTLSLPLQQAVDALTQGETPDQIIAHMNLQGFQAWREATSPQDEHDFFQVRGIAVLVHSLNGQNGLFWTETVTMVICCALLSAGNVTLTFLLRLAILLQALPLFALTIVIGLIDGLVAATYGDSVQAMSPGLFIIMPDV